MRTRQAPRAVNERDLSAAFAPPDQTWCSYGLVDGDVPIDFDPDLGPLVHVTLQPSQLDCYCRVSSSIAGDGEGEFHPFVGGDEVLVLLPQGRPDAGPVIVGRLNNSRQKFPTSIAGQDCTKNTFGFRRARTPRIEELAGPIQLRSALTGGFVSIDASGIATIRDGSGGALQLSPDVFGYQSSDAASLFQIDLSGKRAMLQVGDARFILGGTGSLPSGSSVYAPQNFSMMSGSNAAAEHAISTEAVCNLLTQFGLALLAVMAPAYAGAVSAVPTPFPGSPMTPLAAPFAAALAAAFANPTAVEAAIASAVATPQVPAVAAALVAAFAAALPKPAAAVTGGFQPAPGIGCGNTFIG